MENIYEPDYDAYYNECCDNLEKQTIVYDEIDNIISIAKNKNKGRKDVIELLQKLKTKICNHKQ